MTIWILGAPDPEMEAIARLLEQAGEQTRIALADGKRVTPATAYKANGLSDPIPEHERVVAVECGGPAIPPGAMTIDHHRPGDPGYGRPPAEFLAASSIGQVVSALAAEGKLAAWEPVYRSADARLHPPGSYLGATCLSGWAVFVPESEPPHGWGHGTTNGVEVPLEFVLTAAADHCLGAAYRGECPGVDPGALMEWRARTRVHFQRRPVEEVLEDVERARQQLRAAPRIEIAGVPVADLTASGSIPELPEAAARDGIPFLAKLADRQGEKIVLQVAPPQVVAAWMQQQRSLGRNPYGDPARGFAGAYCADDPGDAPKAK